MRQRSEAGAVRQRAREWVVDVPHDVINEQVLLAAMVVDEEARARLSRTVPVDAFYAKEHRALFAALVELHNRRLEYDPATVARIAGDSVDAARMLEELVSARPDPPANLGAHVEWALWDQQRAQVMRLVGVLVEHLQKPKEAPERVRSLARQVGAAFDGATGRARFLHDPNALVDEHMAEIRARAEGRGVFSIGLPGLDNFEDGAPRLSIGSKPCCCTVISATSGGGKTALAANLALGLARQRRRVLWGAWESGGGMNLETMAVISLGWKRGPLLRGESVDGGRLSEAEQATLDERMRQIGKWITFMKNPFRRQTGERRTNAGNLDVVQAHIEESGCDVFIADLWSRCLADRRPESEEEALFRQQAMVEELRIHAFLLHQQRSKDIELRSDKRPTREGLKGSSAMLEVADTMLAPHLPALWKDVPDDTMEVFILKQRAGGKWPLGVAFDWDGDSATISGGRSIAYNQPGSEADDLPGWNAPQRKVKRTRYA